MKKILVLTLILGMVLSFCACDNASTDEGTNTPDGNKVSADVTNDNADEGVNDEATVEIKEEVSYVGTWKVIPPVKEFPPLTLVINEDGTAIWNKEDHLWYENTRVDAIEGSIEISREDNYGYGDIAYITEDGNLYLEKNLTVQGVSYDHIIMEKQ